MLATSIFGQVDSARLEGTVHDPSGAVIPSVKLSVVNVKTQAHAEAVSDANGNYVFPSLQPGTYDLLARSRRIPQGGHQWD